MLKHRSLSVSGRAQHREHDDGDQAVGDVMVEDIQPREHDCRHGASLPRLRDARQLEAASASSCVAPENPASSRSTSSSVVAGHINAMLWNGVSSTLRLTR